MKRLPLLLCLLSAGPLGALCQVSYDPARPAPVSPAATDAHHGNSSRQGQAGVSDGVPRMVLFEEATNTSCGPCAANNPSLDAFIAAHSSQIVAVKYHAWWPSSSDPMYVANVAGNRNRIDYYYINYVPCLWIDGNIIVPPPWTNQETLDAPLQQRLAIPSPVSITVTDSRIAGDSIVTDIVMNIVSALPSNFCKLRVFAAEHRIEYPAPPGSNGEKEFFDVFRAGYPDMMGFTLPDRPGEYKVQVRYKREPGWTDEELHTIAFVQNDMTREVLNCARATVSSPPFMVLTPDQANVEYSKDTVFVRVSNTGGETLRWTTTNDVPWLHADSNRPDTIAIGCDENKGSSDRTGTVTVASNASNSPLTITVTQAAPPPVMVLTPESFDVGDAGGTAFVRVGNAGGGTLNWTTKDNVPWLHSNSDRPDTIAIACDANGQNSARLGTVTVTSNASNSPLMISLSQAGSPVLKPAAVTIAASNVTVSDARLNGTVNPNGASTTYYFEYGATTVYGSVTGTQDAGSGSDNISVNASVSSLAAATQYHYRLVASNSGGRSSGLDETFTTSVASPALHSPENGAANVRLRTLLRWHPGAGASAYHLQLSLTPDCDSLVVDEPALSDTVFQVALRNGLQDHYWRVHAQHDTLTSGWSAVWTFRTESTVGVRGLPNGIPGDFALEQNYPNPFNPVTTIRYALPKGSPVKLIIMNALGQQVAELVNGPVDAGYHEVQFNAADLASGLYFCRLQAGTYTETRKLVVTK